MKSPHPKPVCKLISKSLSCRTTTQKSDDLKFGMVGTAHPARLTIRNRGEKIMNQETKSAVPRWYWVIAAVALLWFLMDCVVFGIELFALESFLEDWTKPQKAWARSIPGWIYFVFGLA